MSAFRKSAHAVPVSAKAVREAFPGFTFGTFRDPPGQVWADFTHDEDEFVIVAAGEVTVTVGEDAAVCHPGDLVLIPARVPHTLRTSDGAGSVWHYGYGTFGGAHG